MKPTRYTVSDGTLFLVLEPCEEAAYFVTSPFNPDVMTQADTLEEAFEMARDVIALFKEHRAAERKANGAAKKTTPRQKEQKAGCITRGVCG